MKRMFLPVGQGAFYCEKFSNEDFCGKVNVVYDCGSISGLSILKSMIERAFDTGEVIDAVFISHLHEDHINGLPCLMKRCRIKRVYLPMIKDSDLALMRLAYGIQRPPKTMSSGDLQEEDTIPHTFVRDVLINSKDAIRRHAIRYAQGDEAYPAISFIPVDNDDTVHARANMLSREIFGDKIGNAFLEKWTYSPFNIWNETEARTVMSRYVRTFGDDMSSSRISELINEATNKKDVLTKIRELFNGINDGFNANSMVLYSGAVDSTLCQFPDVDKRVREQIKLLDSTISGCLYLGDFIAKANRPYWKKMKTAYRKHWGSIGCVQIPHHGSERCFNEEFLKMKAYNVISAGLGNKYHHPSNIVLLQYLALNTFPFVVTQSPTSVFGTVMKIV